MTSERTRSGSAALGSATARSASRRTGRSARSPTCLQRVSLTRSIAARMASSSTPRAESRSSRARTTTTGARYGQRRSFQWSVKRRGYETPVGTTSGTSARRSFSSWAWIILRSLFNSGTRMAARSLWHGMATRRRMRRGRACSVRSSLQRLRATTSFEQGSTPSPAAEALFSGPVDLTRQQHNATVV